MHRSIPARFLEEQLSQASPDLLRQMLTTFINTLMSAEDDGVTGFDALQTLGAFLDCGGSARATAQRLGLHVNSLRYRLERIAAVCGADLGDPEQRFRLQRALRLRHARKALNER